MSDNGYARKLLEENDIKNAKRVKLQLNLEITEEEAKNLDKLVKILKKNNSAVTKKSICYGALQESGIFNNI